MTTPSFDGQWEAAVRIAGRSGHGARLPRGARRLLETLTGADLSSVRVHTTRDVATLGARAVACGEDVHFAPGRGAPDTEEGMALLGHEVAHVLQQRRAAARAALAAVTLRIDPLDEFEADVLGALAARALASGAARVERSGVARRLVGDGEMRTRRMPRARGRVLQPSILPSGVFGGLDPNKRQNAPNGWARTVVKPDIDWKYHHVISWDALRDMWQGLLEHQAWDALEAYMHAVNVTGAAAIRGKLHRGEDLDLNEREDVYQKISWPSWNIVEGPADRADEGGSELDLFHHGMLPDHALRHTQIGLLWTSMSAFLAGLDRPRLKERREKNKNKNAAPQVKADNNARTNDLAGRLSLALGRMRAYQEASFIPYTPSMWRVVTAGYVDRNARAAWTTRPTFEKADATRTQVGALPARMRCPSCSTAFETPNVVIGTNYPCPSCDKFVYMEFKTGA